MKPTDLFQYYAMGYDYGALRRMDTGREIHAGAGAVVRRLELFFEFLTDLKLNVTMEAATTLRSLLKELKDLPSDTKADDALTKRIQTAVGRIDVTLDAELRLSRAYLLRPKRFNTDQLVNEPATLLRDNVYAALPSLTQYDFQEACLCIAFERPTASAFHLMRCVEGLLRHYYCHTVKRDRVKNLMWFDMLDHLSKRRHPPPKTLVDHLNNLRSNFRNPTQHPDARYDIDQAQDLLGVVIDTVNRIATELKI